MLLQMLIIKTKEFLMGMGVQEEQGQGLVEYALIIVLIAVVVIGVLTLLGTEIGAVFTQITGALGGGN